MRVALWTRDRRGGWHRTSPDTLRYLGILADGLDPAPRAMAWDALAAGYGGAAVTSPDCEIGAVVAAWYLGAPDPRSGVLAVAGGRAGGVR